MTLSGGPGSSPAAAVKRGRTKGGPGTGSFGTFLSAGKKYLPVRWMGGRVMGLDIERRYDLDRGLTRRYTEIAQYFRRALTSEEIASVVEFGAGSGAFTIPLIKALGRELSVYHCVDMFEGPYRGNERELGSRIKEEGLEEIVSLHIMDARVIGIHFEGVDLIIGHDVLGDMDEQMIGELMSSAYSALRDGGIFIHAGISNETVNPSQELLIEMDSYYSGERLRETPWFSPDDGTLMTLSGDAGFAEFDIDHISIPLRIRGDALELLARRWNIDKRFFREHPEASDTGIEFPKEQILLCRK